MKKFVINNRTDVWKTDLNLLNNASSPLFPNPAKAGDSDATYLLLLNYKLAAPHCIECSVFLWIKFVRRFLRSLHTAVLMKRCLHLLPRKNAKRLAVI